MSKTANTGNGYDQRALDVIQRVIEQQSMRVDAVTGAIKSSKLYLITICKALREEKIDLDAFLKK